MSEIKNFDFTDHSCDEQQASSEPIDQDEEERLIDGWDAYDEWLREMRSERED